VNFVINLTRNFPINIIAPRNFYTDFVPSYCMRGKIDLVALYDRKFTTTKEQKQCHRITTKHP